MNIDEACSKLYDEFGCGNGLHPYITSVGVGADYISIFLVRKVMPHEKQIPAEYEGFPVEVRVTGRMRMING